MTREIKLIGGPLDGHVANIEISPDRRLKFVEKLGEGRWHRYRINDDQTTAEYFDSQPERKFWPNIGDCDIDDDQRIRVMMADYDPKNGKSLEKCGGREMRFYEVIAEKFPGMTSAQVFRTVFGKPLRTAKYENRTEIWAFSAAGTGVKLLAGVDVRGVSWEFDQREKDRAAVVTLLNDVIDHIRDFKS